MSTGAPCDSSVEPCDFVDQGWSDGGVFSVLELNLVCAFAIFLIYSCIQSRDANKPLYQPRAFEDNPASDKALPSYKTNHIAKTPPKLSGWFKWAPANIKYVSDEDILVRSGLEAMMFVRFQRALLILLLKIAVLAGVILIPINSTGSQNYDSARTPPGYTYSSGFDDWMVTNLADNSRYLWAHLVVFVLSSLLLYQAYDSLLDDLREQRQLFLKYKVGLPSDVKKKKLDDHESSSDERKADVFSPLSTTSHARQQAQLHDMTHTVLLSGLPPALRDAEALSDHIDTYQYPEALVEPGGALLIYHKPEWRKLQIEEAALTKELIHHHNVLKKQKADGKPEVRPLKRTKMCRTKVDAIDHCEAELKKVRAKLVVEDSKETHPTTGYAFLNFKSEVIAKAMVQNTYFKTGPTTIEAPASRIYQSGTSALTNKLLNADKLALGGLQKGGNMLVPGKVAGKLGIDKTANPNPDALPATIWKARRSPPTDDIVWDNLYMPERSRLIRYVLFTAATWFLILFSAIPIGFLGSLSSLASIPGIGPAFESLQSLPTMLLDAITAYLPVIVLVLFQIFLPSLMCAFARGEGIITNSDVESKAMTSLFTFFFFSTLLTSVIAGGTDKIVEIVDAIAGDPFGQIMAILVAITSPKSGLFCALLLQSAGIGCAMQLLRIGPFIGRRVKLQLAVTEDEVAEANLIEHCAFFQEYPPILLNLTISIFFSLTLPFTPVFGLLFFAAKFFVSRHSIAFVYSNGLETGGKLYAGGVRILLAITACFQLATAGMFGGKLASAQFGIALAFFLYTCLRYPSLSHKLNAVFLQDDWIPDIDLTPEEKADRLKRKSAKDAKAKQQRIEEILRDKSLLEGDEVVVVMSKSEREAAGHNRRRSGVASAEARYAADMAQAALASPASVAPKGSGNQETKHNDAYDSNQQQLGNMDMDAAAAVGIRIASPRSGVDRTNMGRSRTPTGNEAAAAGLPPIISPMPALADKPESLANKGAQGQPEPGTFITIDLNDAIAKGHAGIREAAGDQPLTPESAVSPTTDASQSSQRRPTKKGLKKKKKKVNPEDTLIHATPRPDEHDILAAEMKDLARDHAGIPIDGKAREKIASNPSRGGQAAQRRQRPTTGKAVATSRPVTPEHKDASIATTAPTTPVVPARKGSAPRSR